MEEWLCILLDALCVRIREWFGLERTLGIIQFQPPRKEKEQEKRG